VDYPEMNAFMRDFFETKPFGAAAVGAVTVVTFSHANISIWQLLAVALITMSAYWLMNHR
jgi:hypothetical protein